MNIDWIRINDNYIRAYEKFYNDIIRKGKLGDICYCDLERFFDDNGIIIFINFYYYKNKFKFWIKYNINDMVESSEFDVRLNAKLEAVKKAFEILEKQLKDKLC
jgi:hypothetical protein